MIKVYFNEYDDNATGTANEELATRLAADRLIGKKRLVI
jgi:hypothetical protein